MTRSVAWLRELCSGTANILGRCDASEGACSKGASDQLLFWVQMHAETPVAVYAEGKEHATAVGLTKMSTADIRSINKGIGIETLHYLNDGLWKTDDFS